MKDGNGSTALFIGDTHHPWCNVEYLNRVLDAVAVLQPDIVAQMGDLYDFYSFSRHPKTVNLITPRDELVSGRAGAEAMWAGVHAAAPGARCIQLLGNHDTRIERMVQTKAPELEAVLDVVDFRSLWRFDGVETQREYNEEIEIGGLDRGTPVVLLHGYLSRVGDHARRNSNSTVVGHTHKAGLVPLRLKDRTIWEMNVGYIADQRSKPFSYPDQRLYADSVPGYGVIDSHGPRVVFL